MPREEMKTWIRALRSGDFKQTTGRLQDLKGHCCLGVACELFVPKKDQVRGFKNYIVGALPSQQHAAPDWLKNINEDFYELTGTWLESLNDEGCDGLGPLTFNEIADLLQAVYLRGVLND